MKKSVHVILFALLVIIAGSANADPDKLNFKLDEKKLSSGEIQTFIEEYKVEGKGLKKRVVGVILLDASLLDVWTVLEDWDVMDEYIPGLVHSKTVHVLKPLGKKDEIGNSLIEATLKVVFLSIDYTLDVKFDLANYRQEWSLITDSQVEAYNKKKIPVKKSTGGLKNIEGYEYIEPYGDGSKTIYYYAPIIETSVPLPGFVERALSKRALNDYIKAIRDRVETLKKGKKKAAQ